MVNLSVNVFGENLNLFEVGGRVEGLENTIEGMFGPEGHFKEDTLQKIFRQVSKHSKWSTYFTSKPNVVYGHPLNLEWTEEV